MNKIELARKAKRVASILDKKTTPLTAAQSEKINKLMAQVKAASSVKKAEEPADGEKEEDPKMRALLMGLVKNVSTFNKLKNRKVKQLLPGVTGIDLMQMTLLELLETISKIGTQV